MSPKKKVQSRVMPAQQRLAGTPNKYTDALGEGQVVPDFLPSPAELAFHEEGVKVTLALSNKSIGFFKSGAVTHHMQDQRMIRRLIDAYVDAQIPTLRSTGRADKQRVP